MKLTAQEIARYRPPTDKLDHIVFDETLSGFGLRYRGNKRTWIYQYSFGSGDERVNARMTLGEYPALPPNKARDAAQDLYAKVRLGQHPASDKRTNRSEAKFTFGHMVERYLQARHNQCVRATEISELRWSEVDFDRGTISLPPERTKNGRPHEFPLTKISRSILQNRKRTNGDFVFGRGDRGNGFSGFGKCKERLDATIEKKLGKPMPGWVHHDLRRTFATRLADLGIQPHIIEALLNHVSGHKRGVAGIYNRSAYATEKAQALALWEKHITKVVG